MASQSSSVDESGRPRYLNPATCSKGAPCTVKVTPHASAASSAASLCRLRAAPSRQKAELRCPPANAAIGTCIPQSSHRGRRPSSKMTMTSRGCRYVKCRQRLVQDDAFPEHPATGHTTLVRIFGKLTRYYAGWRPGASARLTSP
jgi:hypothetical protein